MGKSYRRTGNHDVAYCEERSAKNNSKTKEFIKSFKSLSDVEEEAEEFFGEPDE